jgi:hypothetical protein
VNMGRETSPRTCARCSKAVMQLNVRSRTPK